MIPTIVIVFLIGAYSIWVIRKKKQEIQQGKFCSCGCQDCPSKMKCTKGNMI